ncbi:MAG: hypothetical protein JXA89_28395 [Anaerolineae bacterium]|nr:hypothetical protein [Anaerolineae bacterium]
MTRRSIWIRAGKTCRTPIPNLFPRDIPAAKPGKQNTPSSEIGGSLFRPIDPKPKSHPGIISPHGHAQQGRLGESEAASYQARGLTLARIGCTAFMWDMIDYNDSARHLAGSYENETYAVVHRAPWAHGQDERR